MSLVGAALPQMIHIREDKRCLDEWWSGEDLFKPFIIIDILMMEEGDYGYGYVTPWWPNPGSLMGGFDGVPENQTLTNAPWYSEPWVRSGCNGRLGFVGYTRDQYGSALPNCTVRCFLTSTTELVSTVTSDANGFYIATSPYSGDHFLVIHDSTGQIAGASVNTLTPA